jgi:hypothetical protein
VYLKKFIIQDFRVNIQANSTRFRTPLGNEPGFLRNFSIVDEFFDFDEFSIFDEFSLAETDYISLFW